MTRRSRLVALAALGLAVAGAAWWAPVALREVPWFRVRRVEVSGTRYLAPHQVLLAAGIQPDDNVWDDLEAWRRTLLDHPAIADVRISRRLPGTLRVRVEEKRPVAYVEDGALVPVTASGERLPLDPTRAPVDLPIVRSVPDVAPVLLSETERLGRLDPALLAEVSEIRAADKTARVLVMVHRRAEIVLPVGAGGQRLAQLRAVLADLESRHPSAGPASARVDLRFGEQIVVRLPSSV